MTKREKELTYELLEFTRKFLIKEFIGDVIAADEKLLSSLSWTKGDVLSVCNGHHIFINYSEAIEGRKPAGLTYGELLPFAHHDALQYVCSADNGQRTGDEGTAYIHPLGLPDIILLTEADCPPLVNLIGQPIEMDVLPPKEDVPTRIVFLCKEKPIYSVFQK